MTEAVRLNRLDLTDFRNYRRLRLDLDGRHVVLTGENGAGKTNLMEAVSYLSPGRGLRRASYGEAARAGSENGFAIFAALEGMAGPVEIGTAAGAPGDTGARRVRINAAPAKSVDDLLDHLRIAWLTPAMDGLFTGPTGDRRRFLDRMVLAVDPMHGRRAIDFERAMRSRNRLLSEGRMDAGWLSGLETQMAELGVAMEVARRDFVRLLAGVIARGQVEESVFPRAEVTLESFLDAMGDVAAVDVEGLYLEALSRYRRRDQAAGRTLEGPHRSDLAIRHHAKDMPAALCSTGEQKALLTGLVLAQARLTREITGYPPILLLDEIAAHLDSGRRAALFDLVDALGGQAFMTGTDAAMFSALGERAAFLTVSDGTVAPTSDA